MEEEEVQLIDFNENTPRPDFSYINQSTRQASPFRNNRNNRFNSPPIVFRRPVLPKHKTVQTNPPTDLFPATWLVELKSQVDLLYEEISNTYNSFVNYPVANLNEIKTLADHESKHGPVSLVDEHRKGLQQRYSARRPLAQSWEPSSFQSIANREYRDNFQSREQNLKQSLNQMLKSATKLKSLVAVHYDNDNDDKIPQATGATITSNTQTEPIDTYVKFLKIIDCGHRSMSRDSNADEDASSQSNSSSDSSIDETSPTNIHREQDTVVRTGVKTGNDLSLENDDDVAGQGKSTCYSSSEENVADAMNCALYESLKKFVHRYSRIREEDAQKHSMCPNVKTALTNALDELNDSGIRALSDSWMGQLLTENIDECDQNRYITTSVENTSANALDPVNDSGTLSLEESWRGQLATMNVDDGHQLSDASISSSIEDKQFVGNSTEIHDPEIDHDTRTLWGSTLRLPRKSRKDQKLKLGLEKFRQVNVTSWDKLYDVTVNADKSAESDNRRKRKDKLSKGNNSPSHQRRQSSNLFNEAATTSDTKFSFPSYISELKRVHQRKPSTKRTKEFSINGPSGGVFNFEDYCQKIFNLHNKYTILKDAFNKPPSSR